MTNVLLAAILIALIVDGVITKRWLKTSQQYLAELRAHIERTNPGAAAAAAAQTRQRGPD
jgi:hypothetical protein